MNFSDNLKNIRKEHNLSQEQIAEQLGVSRQSVSKWESGQAYPEMDKMIQLCQMFNLNIDDLLNQDIKEINNNKQAKSNVNKFIDDFLEYITKTIDMFSSMKFKEKLKCVFEQLIIIIVLACILFVIGFIGGIACSYLFAFLPLNIYYKLLSILGALYLLLALILGTVLLLHIFKVRYLDYYIIVKSSTKKDIIEEDGNKLVDEKIEGVKKVVLEKKVEKLIIRDPEHSSYRFISWMVRSLLFCVKAVAVFIGLCGCLSLVLLITCLIISLGFIKTGLVFLGAFSGLVAAITINLTALNIIYNFILSKKVKKTKLALIFLASLILGGIGIGLCLIGITSFDIIENPDSKYYKETVVNLEMTDDLYFNNNHAYLEYIESDIEDVKVVIRYSSLYTAWVEKYDDGHCYIHHYLESDNTMNTIRQHIKDINNKRIIDHSKIKIYIYANAENIESLKNNLNEYDEEEYLNQIEIEYQETIDKYETQYSNMVQDYETKLNEYKTTISELETRICELEGTC